MRRNILPYFFMLLVVPALACSLTSGAEPSDSDPLPINEAELVDRAVATVQAGLPAAGDAPIVVPRAGSVIDSGLEGAIVELYRRANPAVVYIITGEATFDLGSGSGFVYDADGHIITNNHVVADGNDYEIVFSDGSRRRAELVGSDVDSDLAVLKVDALPPGTQPLPLATFQDVAVGQFVVAIGNPFGEQGSISLGIISGLGRSITSQRFAENGGTYSLPGVIQTDAPINPGNSGGPLLNLAGQVVGVNSAIRSNTGFNSGVGFAIPVAAVQRVVPSLISEGSYTYPYLGIGTSGGPIDLDRQELLGLPQAGGVYVTSVTPGTPADDAGIIAAANANAPGGDLIIAIDTQPVREFTDLISYLVFQTEVGQTVSLTVFRDGEEVAVPVTLGERP